MGNGCGTGRASAICWSLRTGIWRPVSMRMTPHFHWSISDRNIRPLEPGICGIRLMESEGKMEAGSAVLYTKATPSKGENRNCRACLPFMWSRMRRHRHWSYIWRILWQVWNWCFSIQSMKTCLCLPAAPGLSAAVRSRSAWSGP